MNYDDLKRELSKKAGYREAEKKNRISYDIAKMVIEARLRRGLTQKELAELVGTKQPSIARIENGEGSSSNSFLERIAEALGTKLLPPRFEMLVKDVKFDYATQLIDETKDISRTYINYYMLNPGEYSMLSSSFGKANVNLTSNLK